MSSTPSTDKSQSEPSNPAGVTGKLCNWIHSLSTDDIPTEVLERAKHLILDGIACALVSAHLPWSETAANALFKAESVGQCSVFGWGEKRLSPLAATLLNSTFVQGFELDDYHSTAPLHSNSLLLPALLAAAESDKSSTFSGEEFLRAYIVGCEVGPRVGLALHGADLLSRGWHSGAVQGPSASAAAVSALFHLPPAQIESALGIACTQAGGLMSAQFGSMAKRMQHGFAARNGLLGVLLAKEGYTGIEGVYETPYGGFLSCFAQGANFEPKALPEELIEGLGSEWQLHGIRVKLHAAMAALHGTIDCIEFLQRDHPELFAASRLDDIESIKTEHPQAMYEHGGWIAPPEKPLTSTAAQMSIQYAAAAQLVDHQVLMDQFGKSKLNRPLLRELMAKIHPEHNKSFDAEGKVWRTVVNVRFKDGTEVQQDVDAHRGISPPVSNDEIVDKWRRLVGGVVDEKRIQEIEQCVFGLSSLKDITQLADLLRPIVQCPIDV